MYSFQTLQWCVMRGIEYLLLYIVHHCISSEVFSMFLNRGVNFQYNLRGLVNMGMGIVLILHASQY